MHKCNECIYFNKNIYMKLDDKVLYTCFCDIDEEIGDEACEKFSCSKD